MSRDALRATRLLALAVAVTLFVPLAQAGTTGKLTGKVTNEKKEALPGVNIRVEGQRLGAISDDQGNYFIIGVPAGVYTVRANLLGQAPYTATNVQITPDFTTTLNIGLRTEAVQMNEVKVEAERPLLQKDATGTTRFISSEDIQKLPTRGYRDAAANQTGIVNFKLNIDNEAQNNNTLIIRGGRPNETAYFVDGFSQQDPLTGTSNTSISNNAIEEVVVLTGGFSPEYGRIMSGAVNVITREGGSKLFGAAEAISDVLAGDWVGAKKTDYNVYDLSLGGPILPGSENLTFYVSGERRWQKDRSPSYMTDLFRENLTSRGFDDAFKPANGSSGYTYQGKLSFQPTDRTTLKLGGLGSQDDWRQFLGSYLFDLDHAPRYEDRSQSYNTTLNQVLSTKTFLNIGFNYNESQRKRGDGMIFDNLQPRYQVRGDTVLSESGRLISGAGYFQNPNPRFQNEVPLFWRPGHVFDDYLQRKSSYWGVQAAASSQVNSAHQLKFGGDYQRHTLRLFNHFFPVQLGGESANLQDYDAYGYQLVPTYRDVTVEDRDPDTGDVTYSTQRLLTDLKLTDANDSDRDGPKHPKVWSLFAQDKFEREGVIVNGGLRFDHLNVDTPALVSDSRPLGDPDDVTQIPDSLETRDLTTNKTYARLSPRLGVAFPLDEKTVLRFNYGQFYQQPNLQDLYVSYRFLQHKIRTGGYFVGFGNPNLKPERTTAYEVGMARQVGDNVRMDLTAYYKDVKDLVEIATIPSFPNNFASYRNRDFGTIKGIDVGFKMRPINRVSADINYSLSFATGTGSVSNTQRNIAWTASQPPKQTAPLDFDQRHKLSLNLDYRLGKGEGPLFGNLRILENMGFNFLYNVASGTPYTPTKLYNEVTLAAVSLQPSGPLNSRYGPWTSNLDFKATKGFGLAGLDLEGFVWVLNAFNSRNPNTVYTSSGSALSTNFLASPEGQAFIQSANNRTDPDEIAEFGGLDGESLFRLAENNPNLFSNPRLVRFGLRTSF